VSQLRGSNGILGEPLEQYRPLGDLYRVYQFPKQPALLLWKGLDENGLSKTSHYKHGMLQEGEEIREWRI
jgi:hypothetical protein